MKMQDCSPQLERDIHLQDSQAASQWSLYLLRTPSGLVTTPATPFRLNLATPFQTLVHASTIGRTIQQRAIYDHEALPVKQLVDFGVSARKKVLHTQAEHPAVGLGLGLPHLEIRSVAVFRVEQASQHSDSKSMLGTSILSTSSRISGMGIKPGPGLGRPVKSKLYATTGNRDVPALSAKFKAGADRLVLLAQRAEQFPLRGKRNTLGFALSPRVRAGAPYEDKSCMNMSLQAESAFSYEYLDQMERRYKRHLGEVSGMIVGPGLSPRSGA
ncbi:hypothetical protein LXA43DRAFT_1113839 [Ganoderma leucocontextum]|nr:hypothetical protein LXA43DRAFT_1113839 [Ganoderma leucocontextum]